MYKLICGLSKESYFDDENKIYKSKTCEYGQVIGIGRGRLIPWSPRSPDLISIDFLLWEKFSLLHSENQLG